MSNKTTKIKTKESSSRRETDIIANPASEEKKLFSKMQTRMREGIEEKSRDPKTKGRLKDESTSGEHVWRKWGDGFVRKVVVPEEDA